MNRRAFTLIEVIIAGLIMAAVVVSIYSAFSIGMNAWRKGSSGGSLQKTRIALLRLQKELKDSFFFSGAGFKGGPLEMAFPLAASEGEKDKAYVINYYVAEDKRTGLKSLMRKEMPFPVPDNQEGWEEVLEELKFSAESITFQYAYKSDSPGKAFEWRDTWGEAQDKMPLAVKISFKLKGEDVVYGKTIFIPQGELGAE